MLWLLSPLLLAGSIWIQPAQAIDASGFKDKGLISAAWYAGWHSSLFPLDKISWDKYTHVTYSFATTTGNGKSITLEESDAAILPSFVKKAHDNDVKALLSIGGWGGSTFFSTNVGSAENRTSFVKTILETVDKYEIDGVDFDWEYPNKQGSGCNTINSNDTPNLLSLLQELRNTSSSSHPSLLISAATFGKTFNDTTGTPSTDVSAFAEVLDFIAIMNYDIWTYLSDGTRAGPTSPLDDSCAPGGVGSAVSALKAWTDAGFPAEKIVLGVPGYGHSFTVAPSDAFVNGSDTELALYPPVDQKKKPMGDSWDGEGEDSCGVNQGFSGVFNYWSLYEEGFLADDGSVAHGIGYVYDNCSQTPSVYNSSSKIMVAYDDERSFAAKGNFIKENNLKGFSMWELAGDYEDRLISSILSAVTNGNGSATTSSNGAATDSGRSDSEDSGDGAITSTVSVYLAALLTVLSLTSLVT